MLHTVSDLTIDTAMIHANDAVLFWQNGVILATKDHPLLATILAKTPHCYVLDNDILARGLTPFIDQQVEIIDMKRVVLLTEIYYPQMKW